jgi:predicted O-linked N-acetylglucosamine transferase (SPINDLY family)
MMGRFESREPGDEPRIGCRLMSPPSINQALRQALGHHRAGRLAEAETIYRQVLAQAPDHADALHLLGVLALQGGQAELAIDLIDRAVAIEPLAADYHVHLGEAYRRLERWDEAVVRLRRSVELRPDDATVYNNLGVTLDQAGRPDEAIAAYQRALAIAPDDAWAHANLGNAWNSQGRLDEALAAYQHALRLDPGLAEVHSNLGTVLHELGRTAEAIAACERALELKPDHPQACHNLGCALQTAGRLDEAVAAFERAIQLSPGYAEPYNALGNVFKDQGLHDEALACFRKALERRPDFPAAASNLLYTVYFHPDADAPSLLAAHRLWARQYADPLVVEIQPHPNCREPDRRLKVGFVSPDFRDHPLGRSLLPWFPHVDRRRIELVCFSDARVADGVTERLRGLADAWHEISGLSDAALAAEVRADGIDILVDLAQHTASNRLLVFARKPAPVQATMLGMPGTTGLSTMDYRLTDPHLDPPGTSDHDSTERSIRLPRCYWCYEPRDDAPAVGPLPAERRGFVTFGCLNQFAKVSRPSLELWARILRSVPGARLLVHSQPGRHLEAVRRMFVDDGVAPDRVAFVGPVPHAQYLALFNGIDLCLDPFPYGGGITTMDSLWMGVPVITLAGRTAVGRAGASILANVGLPELIAQSPEEYVAHAIAWAGDRVRLSALRSGLRQRMRALGIMDGRRYAADMESLFRQMWRDWCSRERPLTG